MHLRQTRVPWYAPRLRILGIPVARRPPPRPLLEQMSAQVKIAPRRSKPRPPVRPLLPIQQSQDTEMVLPFISLSVPAPPSPRSQWVAFSLPRPGVRVQKKIWSLTLGLESAHDKRYYGRLLQAKKGEWICAMLVPQIDQRSCRYVAELLKMKDAFIVPLLHPYATSPMASPTMLDYDDAPRLETPVESLEHLPIASRFLSPTGFRSDTPTAVDQASRREDKDAPNIDSESLNSDYEDENDRMGKGFLGGHRRGQGNMNLTSKHNHPRSPYGTSRIGKHTPVPFPSRSHQSLPPPPRPNPNAASTHSLGRQSFMAPPP